MPYTFTSSFDTADNAIRSMASISSTISELTGINDFDIVDGENLRMIAIQNLAEEIIDNVPDVFNESYPQVPSFSVNAYNFFFRSDKNIGFGVSYDRETNKWIATISLYLPARLFKTNACARNLINSDGWALMPYTPRKNRKKNDESTTVDNEDTMQSEEE